MSNEKILSCFKSYDVRGRLGSEIDEDIAYKIGNAIAKQLDARKVVIGYDARESSQASQRQLQMGFAHMVLTFCP